MVKFFLVGTLALLAWSHLSRGAPPRELGPFSAEVVSFGERTFISDPKSKKPLEGAPGKKVSLIVIGQGVSYLGLYLFDANGNCLARDEPTNYITGDDLALDWVPHGSTPYSVEVRNLGNNTNPFGLLVKVHQETSP